MASGPSLGSEDCTRGSTMMSKSETFHGPAGILTLSSSVPPPPNVTHKHDKRIGEEIKGDRHEKMKKHVSDKRLEKTNIKMF